MNYFFTADQHFGHYNIIKHCSRPFQTLSEMDKTMLDRWNSRIAKDDIVFHLGDLCYSKDRLYIRNICSSLNGSIHLIRGNHDRPHLYPENIKVAEDQIQTCVLHLDFSAKKSIYLVLCHYALRTWSGRHRGVFHLFGHSHGKINDVIGGMDVGVDTNNFYPYSLQEVYEKLREEKNAMIKHELG